MSSVEREIEALRGLVSPVLTKFDGRSLQLEAWTSIHVLERVASGLLSLQALVIDGLNKHEHSIGLISRTLLSDFLVICHVIRVSRDESIESNLMLLYRQDIKKVNDHIDRFVKHGEFTLEEYTDYVSGNRLSTTIGDLVDQYFDNNSGSELRDSKIKKKWATNTDIVDGAMNMKPRSKLAINIIRAYDQWFTYAKYEHVGWHSYVRTRPKIEGQTQLRLELVLLRTSLLITLCLGMLKETSALERSYALMRRLFEEITLPADQEANPEEEIRKIFE